MRIRPIRPIHAYSAVVYDGEVQLIDIVFLSELIDDKERIELREHDDVSWIGERDIGKFEMSEQTSEALRKCFELISSREGLPWLLSL